jgi:hypothetical protein
MWSLFVPFITSVQFGGLQFGSPDIDNEFVRVTRNAAPCSTAPVGCGDRIIVPLTRIEMRAGNTRNSFKRGEIVVFKTGESYQPPIRGQYYEVSIKLGHPAGGSAGAAPPPAKNTTLYDGGTYFVFEERLAIGAERGRHGHSHRVVIQLNQTRLRQKSDGGPEVDRDIAPDRAAFNPPVVHTTRNIGTAPLHGIVIEFRPR